MNELELFHAEVSDQCTPEQARDLTDRIKLVLDGIWELVKVAYTSRAWAALGYSSWDDYCTREFGSSRLRLPREERGEVTGSLRDAGLSLRAIASATGLSEATVRRDLAGASFDAPEVATSQRLDKPAQPTGEPERPASPTVARPPAAMPRTQGVDGKSYRASRPMPAERPNPVAPTVPSQLFREEESEVVDAEIVEDASPPPEPAPEEEAARALRSFIDADPAQRVAAWRTSFIAAIARTTSIIPSFKPEAVAENADEDLMKELRDAHRHLGNYIDRINAQRPAGLRLVRRG